MSSQKYNIFELRNQLHSLSIHEFKNYIAKVGQTLTFEDISNLANKVFNDHRDKFIDYLSIFIQYDRKIIHCDILMKDKNKKKVLEVLCETSQKVQEINYLIKMIEQYGHFDIKYSLYNVIWCAINNIIIKNREENGILILEEIFQNLSKIRWQEEKGQENLNQNSQKPIMLYLIERQYFAMAIAILKYLHKIPFFLKCDGQELFAIKEKSYKKDKDKVIVLIGLIYEKNKKNNFHPINLNGKKFIETVPTIYQHEVQEIIKKTENSPIKTQQNKVITEYGNGGVRLIKNQNELMKTSITSHQSQKQKILFSINTEEDEKSIRSQANKVYEKLIIEKEKHCKIQKMYLNKELKQSRSGVMKSDELKFYLDEDIAYEVEIIKRENNKNKKDFDELICKITNELTASLPIEVKIFGSYATSLCLPESDIDIMIIPKERNEIYSFDLLERIHQILLKMRDEIESSKLIKTATVPIIKVDCSSKYHSKKIDITYKDANHNGLESVELIAKYLNMYEHLESLIFVLKKFIYTSSLFAPYSGGLSSYGLILMIVAFIQHQNKRLEIEKKKEKLSVSELLIGFLKFYGFKLNYVMKCIHIFNEDQQDWNKYNGCVIRDPTNNNMIDLQPKLVIIDPLNENNNVGRSTHKIKQIQMAFQIAYIAIHTLKNCSRKKKCESFKRIHAIKSEDIKYYESRPCCILKRMFNCTDKFIKE